MPQTARDSKSAVRIPPISRQEYRRDLFRRIGFATIADSIGDYVMQPTSDRSADENMISIRLCFLQNLDSFVHFHHIQSFCTVQKECDMRSAWAP